MHPLDGIKVADFTTMINGPFAAMMLAEMGADVIKVEPPDGDPWRSVAGGFICYNRGKRSISMDLKKDEAKEIAFALIAESDVLVENARWGVWHRLGLDYESVVKIKPDIIYLSSLGHGSKGPYSSLPGYDPLLQARSGQMVGQGGIDKPPVYHQIAINDLACPMLAAYGVVLALLSRARTGKGQRVEISLTNASIALQAGEFVDYAGMERKYLGGSNIQGLSATHRHYQTKDDRYIFVLCPYERQWQSLCQVIGLEELLSDPRFENFEKRAENDESLVELLSEAFKTRTADEWVAGLEEEDVPVALGQMAEELPYDQHCLENKIFDEREYPVMGNVRAPGIVPLFSEMSGIIRRRAPLFGEHTEEVLAELGYTSERISELKDNKIVYVNEEEFE
ncbi:MAG: CoA transferase [Deltaproteobacteria bacterium]|nr:CoA transferase [Deltaproteobacteria bacterium]MBW2051163.1 CoA transferase [Deltaproteobacteria bacterium]MBW2140011.1 CoA transferase [Deltaproteobacteria bacterium]MBW2322333.1 CoA transferase [Deltaproteobacteria bacterium]